MKPKMNLDGRNIKCFFVALLITVIFIGTTAALPFSIGSGDKDEYRSIVGTPGEIRVQAAWTGVAKGEAWTYRHLELRR